MLDLDKSTYGYKLAMLVSAYHMSVKARDGSTSNTCPKCILEKVQSSTQLEGFYLTTATIASSVCAMLDHLD